MQTFTRSKDPALLSVADVKGFLTHLAVEREVSASTQNQAFNGLLFLFRNVLGREFGKVDGVVRAKRKRYIPTVLSRDEVERVVAQLSWPYDLAVKLMYGCGLRISECVGLRVQCLDMAAGMVTVHGKGGKDRTVPMPVALVDEIEQELDVVRKTHQVDLAGGYAGVFLPSRLEQKYPKAPREFRWQWFFPAKQLTRVADTGELRRYHLHPSHVQFAIRQAAEKAVIGKRVTAHTFRHTFATHLLQANYDIRTIQEMLGHGDVRTTMIYTHAVPSRTLKERKSPLDIAL